MLVEWVLTLPLLLLLLVGLVDAAQLVLLHAQVDNLTREAGNLASRGLTLDQTWDTMRQQDAPLDLEAEGQVIITVITRRNPNGNAGGDDEPWIQDQRTFGGKSWIASDVGSPGGAARVPAGCTTDCITSLPTGIVMVAVETAYTYRPLIPPPRFTELVYPDFVNDRAYF